MNDNAKLWLNNYPEGVPPSIDYPQISLYEFLERSASKFPNNNALIFFGNKIKYRDLLKSVDAFAGALKNLGLSKGDRLSIMLPNSPQMVIAYYAALKIGAIVVQTNPLYKEKELSHQLEDSGAETIVCLDLVYNNVKKVLPNTKLKNIIVTAIKDYLPFPLNLIYPLKQKKEGQKPDVPKNDDFFWFKDLINLEKSADKANIDPDEDVALLQYTGGTTGLPKGTMLTHKNLVSNTMQVSSWVPDIEEGKEVLMGALPFFHVYGMTVGMNLAVYNSSPLVLVPRFDVDQVMKQIQKYKVTLFPGAPTMYVAVINHPKVKNYDLSSIKACISGAAPLPVEVQKQFESLTGGKLVEGYGLSEASPVTHANPLYGVRKEGSIGFPMPDTECKLIDADSGEEVTLGERGELVVSGPQVMKGYWNMPGETSNVLSSRWLYTGDIAVMDEEGYFYIVDRKKDVILTGGFSVFPRDVEEVLYQHPAIEEAAVVGVSDEYKGETVKACISVKEGEEVTKEEIRKFCKEQLAPYKVPKVVEFMDELPKTLVGKISRRMLTGQEVESFDSQKKENESDENEREEQGQEEIEKKEEVN
ncbi:long-chain-fatty-acid--CoA ligase [Natranaerofaba carboxydovora]|uniref:long-chain-fatty-acid--CoA ligase n=1 Tax=Natranaerofaba carboxydovora TaxID=2742683 RepID=UPI001F13F641|nr:long-chain fatty acid--CoA ligase [Natranaerofaba carboxydovora]UMZ73281.1 Long-chain-fatty-acid--CoA ligase [Natranaerofaba carboxydovora]